MSYHVDRGVLPNEALGKASELVQQLSNEQLIWLGGYLSGVGLAANKNGSDIQHAAVSALNTGAAIDTSAQKTLSILIGSHSGNGQIIGKAVCELAKEYGRPVKLVNMADYNAKQLKKESDVLVIVSTHGEGEPPVQAAELYRFLGSKRVGNLSHLNYAVVALGDSAYQYFCKTGLDFHERLQAHGAKALADPLLLDVDFKDELEQQMSDVLKLFSVSGQAMESTEAKASVKSAVNDGLFEAEIFEKTLLNGRGSDKETYHIELDLEGSGISYKPGDVLEVFPVNDEQLVDSVLSALDYSGSEFVNCKDKEHAIKDVLLYYKEITRITLPVLTQLAAFVNEPDLNSLLDKQDELEKYLEGMDLLDLLSEYRFAIQPQELVDVLRSLVPRAYSISSSQKQVDEEIHLTVGAVRYTKSEREHHGVCSSFLIDRLQVGDKVAVRVKTNDSFRLPADDKPLILIGAGTGIAPYRSFIQERAANKAEGENWLFFGDQHFETDFLYQAEWLKYRIEGVLNKIDVAFSRDQKEKIYVQHRLKEHANEIYKWLQSGAHIYVCGDRKKMAKDVQVAFLEILVEQGGLSHDEAGNYLRKLRQSGHYQEDIY